MRALVVFAAVGRQNSFSRAAAELRVTQSAVSHQIRLLEEYLGEQLLLREGRKVSLTEAGQHYFEAIGTALSDIERASERLRGGETTELRLAAFSSFAVRWLVPRLPDLQRRYPELRLMLEMVDAPPELSDRVADCFILLASDQRGYSSELLYREALFPICSHHFWQRIQSDLQSEDSVGDELTASWLTRYPLLSANSVLGGRGEDWRQWFAAAGVTDIGEARMQHFSHMLLAHEAVRHDQGIALTNDYMVSAGDDAEYVRLPCPHYVTGDEFHFLFKTSRRNEPAIRIIRQWLLQQARVSGLLGN
ncbi:LysR substrate-binding domain-containing protein [Alkalilimnicola ehrlichii]|nr:LysR substrate-binding domain-containing protein [Alkalilimnicola ehrlichii]